jgi:hypothetical protein
VREELQCGSCERIRTGAVGLRMEKVGGRRGEGNGRSQAALRTARGGFGGGQVRADLDPRGGGGALMARQVGRRSCGAKAAVGRDELGGDAVQPGTASSPIHAKVEAGATQRRFDAQRMTGGGGRPALMAS